MLFIGCCLTLHSSLLLAFCVLLLAYCSSPTSITYLWVPLEFVFLVDISHPVFIASFVFFSLLLLIAFCVLFFVSCYVLIADCLLLVASCSLFPAIVYCLLRVAHPFLGLVRV